MFKSIYNSKKLQELKELLTKEPSILIEGLWEPPKALIASFAQKILKKKVLIITGSAQEENKLYQDLQFFSQVPVFDFPAWETLPSEGLAPSPDVVGDRYKILEKILQADSSCIILSNLQACLQKTIPPKNFETLSVKLQIGKNHSFESLIEQLKEMEYTKTPIAGDKGEFATRGGIIDIFPVSSPDPFRIEFWDDEIESIRIFDPIGQKSIRALSKKETISITPAKDLELHNLSSDLSTILEFLGDDTLVIFDDLLALEDRYASLVNTIGKFPHSFCSMSEFLTQTNSLQNIFLSSSPIETLCDVQLVDPKEKFYSKSNTAIALSFEIFDKKFSTKRWISPFEKIPEILIKDSLEEQSLSGEELLPALEHLKIKNDELHFICSEEHEISRVKKQLSELNLSSEATFQKGYLSSGLALSEPLFILFPYSEITGRHKIRRQKQRSTYHTTPLPFQDLSSGETIVHMNHGVGKFLGLKKQKDHNEIEREFFLVEYAKNSKLYIPLNQSNLISKYIGSGETSPKLDTIGSTRWSKRKRDTEQAILGYAADLLNLQAKRAVKGGTAYPKDSEDIQLFKESFPFTETEDQLIAIEDLNEDLLSESSMDRLICGDVGYGKTEVAMRAAFKTVVDGEKQVAVLVPTTVLAMQHFETFCERMAGFPINIGVLSRFRTPKQIKNTLEEAAKGSLDIIIGTHRIISKDVVFKNLGLIIIDEEQRFGVRAKEYLKKIKTGVDCLTLSATPIPRTLYLSLVGARKMSVINTPPQDRLPVKSFITTPDDKVIHQAILRELSRDGQVYVIHNRVETIFEIASKIKSLLPQAKVVVGHGQMSSAEIDQVFHAFKNGEVDVLVATTIVESGLDIPNANTILIDRADRFGMADLYQLRGRVGRWNRRAYCYFMAPQHKLRQEIVQKRLSALAESSGYGGGMKIAMRDLEIRGAGNILGEEQSGHVSAIGFHLYCKLLKKAVHSLQGKTPCILYDTKLEYDFEARLTEEYVNETCLRMEIYQRIGETETPEELDDLWKELKDRFGPPPKPAKWLYHLTRIRIFASKNAFSLLKFDKFTFLAEQKRGKETITKTLLLGKYSTPQNLEALAIKALKKGFQIK